MLKMSGNETRRKAGLECSFYFSIHCLSLVCFLAEGEGEREAWG